MSDVTTTPPGKALERKKHRIILDFAPETYDQFQEIKTRSGDATNAQLIRRALRVYDWVLRKEQEGWGFEIARGVERYGIELSKDTSE